MSKSRTKKVDDVVTNFESNINFDNVTKDKKGCGFRHEEFPNIKLADEERNEYLYLTKKADELQKLLYNIPFNLNNFIINMYIKNIIEAKVDCGINIRTWWDKMYEKYNLTCYIKYNAYENKFFRHITDDNQVTEADRVQNN
jgi:hypothetical protein